MATTVKSRREWDKTQRLNESHTSIDVNDPIGATCAGKLIRDVNDGNFDNIVNIEAVASSFSVKGESQPVQVGMNRVVVLKDKKGMEHRMDPKDDGTIEQMIKAGMEFLRTEEVPIMG